ncbi:uncharacterized protein Z518_02554 [Rhinocladiella mackenziei CBS 650.93]|uniref:2,4-dienoyl-CoA reductase [(3E)-enoyl-CoA-producing] n=1 Tax=Rhinocladiella mackenziei CBS 650.93 TaxID=1442369 RepID=A0A0D2JF97_9EURO|nr:uncharacterized protein Z518_02554 [Rhinocladiella mackenziei CBS 650.93]KIX07900.1 hypothetical protein Z518_02554 [Rhinocladiella mackenziei CBS 650.93]
MKDGKIVFCTGGAGDICSARVRALGYLGADACIVGRNVAKTERTARILAEARQGARVIGLGAVDVRNYESLQNAVERCVKELGGIDFVIAGAAGNFLAPITQLSPNAFRSVIDIDLIGSFHTLKATLPYLEKSAAKHRSDGVAPSSGTGGRIIFVSSTLQYRGTALQIHGCAAKAGVDALSSCLAIEFEPRGLTSNIIAPGPIAETEGLKRMARVEGYHGVAAGVPVGRCGTVKEIADATIYLFSDTGSYVNGATLVVDGGAWRTQGASTSPVFPYPEFFLSRSIDEKAQYAKL